MQSSKRSKIDWTDTDYEVFHKIRLNDDGKHRFQIVSPFLMDLTKKEYERLKPLLDVNERSLSALKDILRGFSPSSPEHSLLTRIKNKYLSNEMPLLAMTENAMETMVKEMLRNVDLGATDRGIQSASILGQRILSVQELTSVSREAHKQIQPHLKHWIDSLKPVKIIGELSAGFQLVGVRGDSWMALQFPSDTDTLLHIAFVDLKKPFDAGFQHLKITVPSLDFEYERGFYGNQYVVLLESKIVWYSMDSNTTVQYTFDFGVLITEFAISPDGNTVAVYLSSDNKVYIYQKHGDEILTTEHPFDEIETIKKLLWSPDGKTLVVYTTWDAEDDEVSVHSMYFMEDFMSQEVQVYDIRQNITFIENHDYGIKKWVFTPDSKHLIYSMKISELDEYLYRVKRDGDGWKSRKLITNRQLTKEPYKILRERFIQELTLHEGDIWMVLRKAGNIDTPYHLCRMGDVFGGNPVLEVVEIDSLPRIGVVRLYLYKNWKILRAGSQLRLYIGGRKPYIVLDEVSSVYVAGENLYFMYRDGVYRFSLEYLNAFVFGK